MEIQEEGGSKYFWRDLSRIAMWGCLVILQSWDGTQIYRPEDGVYVARDDDLSIRTELNRNQWKLALILSFFSSTN
jgi:hypothetical protein